MAVITTDKVAQLKKEGKKVAEIARIYGVNRHTVYYHLEKLRRTQAHLLSSPIQPSRDYNALIDWRVYNEGLVKRGEMLLEMSLFKDWAEELRRMNQGKLGRPFEFPESFIRFLMRLKCGFNVGYRQVEGIARKLYVLIPDCARSPDYSTLQKRFTILEVALEVYQGTELQETALDSSGIKTSNRGEYKALRYDQAKRKEYVKIHIGLNIKTQQVIACEVTASQVHDGEVAGDLIREGQKMGPVNRCLMDSGYDSKKVYGVLMDGGIKPVIKPARRGSLEGAKERYRRLKEKPDDKLNKVERAALNRLGEVIEYLADSKKWKDKMSYGMRWFVEGFFSAFKRIFSEHVFSHKQAIIIKELKLKCNMMNLFRYVCRGYQKTVVGTEAVVKISA